MVQGAFSISYGFSDDETVNVSTAPDGKNTLLESYTLFVILAVSIFPVISTDVTVAL